MNVKLINNIHLHILILLLLLVIINSSMFRSVFTLQTSSRFVCLDLETLFILPVVLMFCLISVLDDCTWC